MSDAATSTDPVNQPFSTTPSLAQPDPRLVGDEGTDDHSEQRSDAAAAATAAAADVDANIHPHVRARNELTKGKIEFVNHLLRSLDILVYCHFSYLYFLDISLFRFMIRAIVHFNIFAQKPPNFPAAQRPKKASALGAIITSTIFCSLVHIFSAAPSAGEASGGYLHGGFIIDFIGQEGPISKFRLFILDLIILSLQLIMLSTRLCKQDLTDTISSSSATRNTPLPQDLNSEERGEDRATTEAINEESRLEDSEREELLRGEEPEGLVSIWSGETIAADLRLARLWTREWESGGILEASSGGTSTGTRLGAGESRVRVMGLDMAHRSRLLLRRSKEPPV